MINHASGKPVDDEFYTKYEDVKMCLDNFNLKGLKIWLPFDSDKSAFVKYFHEKGLTFKNTSDDYKNHLNEEFEWCDCIISNPPFSLYKEIWQNLNLPNKKFLLLAPLTVINRPYVFHAFKNKKIDIFNIFNSMVFDIPGNKEKSVNCVWLTNMPHGKIKKRKRKGKREIDDGYYFDEPKWSKYKNYNTVLSFLSSGDEIGGVPISIVTSSFKDYEPLEIADPHVKGRHKFRRMIIRRTDI